MLTRRIIEIAEDQTLAALHKTGAISTDERLLVATLKTKIVGTTEVFVNILKCIRPPTMPVALQEAIQKQGKRTSCLHLIRCANKLAYKNDERIINIAKKRLERLEESMEPVSMSDSQGYMESYWRCPALPHAPPFQGYHHCACCQDCWDLCHSSAKDDHGYTTAPFFLTHYYDTDQLYWMCEHDLVQMPDPLPVVFQLGPEPSTYDPKLAPTNLLFDMITYMDQHHNDAPSQAPYYDIPPRSYGVNYQWRAHVRWPQTQSSLYDLYT